jgi:hypothetical protein
VAEGNKAGSIFVELSLDATKYTTAQQEILAAAEKNSANIQETFRRVGTESDKIYNAMRQSVQNSLEAIKKSHLTSAEEKIRAEKAAADRIKKIDEEQFGGRASLLDRMKDHWVATTAAVTAAWMTANKAMEWADIGAKAQQAEESFRIVAANTGANADKLLADLKRVSAGTVDESDIMQKAVKGMALGLEDNQIVKIMETARISARIAGKDVNDAYEDITDAIATKMPRALRRYGLVTTEEMEIVKKAMKDGVENVDLYTLAMLNAEIQAARMGKAHANAAESVQIFHAQIKETKETIGKFVVDIGVKLVAGLHGVAGALSYVAAPLAYVLGGKEAYNAMVESGTDLLDKARKMVGAYTDEEKKSAEESKRAADAQIKVAEEKKKAWLEDLKAQAAAKKAEEEYQRLLEQWKNTKIELEGKISGAGLDELTKKLIGIRTEAEKLSEKFKAIPGALALIKEWQEGAEGEAQESENERLFKADMEREKKRLEEQRRAADEYRNIVTEAQNWSISEHQRAINKILSDETKHYARLFDLWEEGLITKEEREAGVAALRQATAIATEIQERKKLSDEVSFYEHIMGYEEKWYEAKLKFIENEKQKRIELNKDVAAAETWAAQQSLAAWKKKWDMEHQGISETLAATKNMFSQAANLFDENSRARKRMHELEKAFTAAEIVLQMSKNLQIAVGAIANQGSGDPYTAFGRIAAMMGVMSGVLALAGLTLGGSGGGAGSGTGVQYGSPQKTTTTVYGAAGGTESESIKGIFDLLKDTYDLELRELTGIHSSIRQLSDDISGLVAGVMRVEGFSTTPPTGGRLAEWATGVMFDPASIRDLISGASLGAQQYERYHLYGGNRGTETPIITELEEDVTRLFTKVFRDMGKTLIDIAKELGTDVQEAMNYIFPAGEIDFTGKTGEEINKSLMDYFSSLGDEAAKTLFGELIGKYQQLNEGMLETAVRVVRDYSVVREIMEMIGKSFDGSKADLIGISEELIVIAGGLDELASAASRYYDLFFSEAEKLAYMKDELTESFSQLDRLAFPETREEFRKLVESLDLTTEAGRETYVALMKMASAVDAVYAAQEKVVKDWDNLYGQLLGLQGDDAAALAYRRQQELDAADEQLRVLMKAIYAQEDYNAAVEKSANAQRDYETAVGNTKQALDSLARAADQVTQAEEKYQSTLAAIVDAQRGLGSAQQKYADALEAYAREQRIMAAEQARAALAAQLETEAAARAAEIARINDESKYWEEQIGILADQLNTQQEMVDKLTNISSSVRSWVASMSLGEYAPVLSREAYVTQYQRLRGAATGAGASETDVSAFLSFAQQYLQFQREYGGDYQAIYDAVMADAQAIADAAAGQLSGAEQQLAATKAADEAARANADRLAATLASLQQADELAKQQADEMLAQADQQIEELRGTNDRLASLQDAIDSAAQGIIDAQDRLAAAQRDAAEAQAAIAEAEAGVRRAQEALLSAQQEEAAALARLEFAQQAEIAAMNNLAIAMNALAAKPPPQIYVVLETTTDTTPQLQRVTVRDYPVYGPGGLATRPSIFGDRGPEWAVPAYEPERSTFLSSAPAAFWENLSNGLRGTDSEVPAGGGEITIHTHVCLDGKEIGSSIARQIPRNEQLAAAIRQVH